MPDKWQGLALLASSLLGAMDEEAAASVGRDDLTDKAWEQIVPLRPKTGGVASSGKIIARS